MKWELRKVPSEAAKKIPYADLPLDYLKVVAETLTATLQAGLDAMKKIHPVCEFSTEGTITGEEVLMAVTLSHGEKVLSASTIYASADFRPLQTKPSIEDTLAACVDAIAASFDHFLDPNAPERIEQLSDASLGACEDAPFDWSRISGTGVPVWVKMDKANLKLDALADQWLQKNDPEFQSKSEHSDKIHAINAEEFLEERLEAINKVRSGGGGPQFGGGSGYSGGSSGPITH